MCGGLVAGLVLRIGQVQLLRRHIAHQLRFHSQLDSNMLVGALEGLNTAVLNDVRRHYFRPDDFPYPDRSNPLLPEISKFMSAAGHSEPMDQIYLTRIPMPHIGLWLSLFALQLMPQFQFDGEFHSLVRRKTSYGVDGTPLIAGLGTMIRQLHPSVLKQFVAYSGQYVRTAVFDSFSGYVVFEFMVIAKHFKNVRAEKMVNSLLLVCNTVWLRRSKIQPLSSSAVNLLILVKQFCTLLQVPRRVVDRFIPSYIRDSVDVVGK